MMDDVSHPDCLRTIRGPLVINPLVCRGRATVKPASSGEEERSRAHGEDVGGAVDQLADLLQ